MSIKLTTRVVNKVDDEKQKDKQDVVRVIARAASIMRTLSEHPEGLSLSAIAKNTGLPRSTIQRLTHTLVSVNLVEPLASGRGFRMGVAHGKIINRAQIDVITMIRPYLHQLLMTFDETSFMSRLIGTQPCAIEQLVAERVMRIVVPLGTNTHYPGYQYPDGLVMLSCVSDQKLLELFKGHFTDMADGQHKFDLFMQRIHQVRKQGYMALSNLKKPFEGVSMISVPIKTFLDIYALNIIAPDERFVSRIEGFQAALLYIKREIESKVGF